MTRENGSRAPNGKVKVNGKTVESYKKENNNEIVLLFSNNGIINLFCEIIECTLEDVKVVND